MKKFSLVFITTLLILVACNEDSNKPDNIGSISGKVIDKLTSTGLANAFIRTEPPTTSINTSADGSFKIENCEKSVYTIIAEKDGYYKYQVQIKVLEDKETQCVIPLLSIKDGNHPPNTPNNPHPGLNDNLKLSTLNLTWNCTDPDADKLVYDVYFGTDKNNLIAISTSLNDPVVSVSDLKDSTTYYWYVIAKDIYGATTKSDMWKFSINFKSGSGSSNPDITNPFCYFPFDGDINDNSPNHWATSFYNISYTSDRFNIPDKAAYFNGKGRVVIEDENASEFLNYDITMSVWLRPLKSGAVPNGTHIGLVNDQVNKITFGITYLNEIEIWTSGSSWCGCTPGIPDDKWTHVAFVFNRTTKTISIFINGDLCSSAFVTDLKTSQLAKTDIGGRSTFNDFYSGAMDDLRIYRRALSAQEIVTLSTQ